MREFPYKLSASGWDLARVKTHPTTGFSGTNDSQHVLPLDIDQLNLPSQQHTNALVLEYLLQPENSVAMICNHGPNVASTGQQLLNMVTTMSPDTRVILDVGAQIIELTNVEVASQWLSLTADQPEIQAVIFLDDSSRISVMNREKQVESLQTSSFAKQLDACLVFLDEAHTRAIDLQLPLHYRAAVTLGAGLTKDRLVQACMRMRKLGSGQSVVFCVTDEIKTKILKVTGGNVDNEITVGDIITWTMSETILGLQRTMPIWAAQGRTFIRQKDLWAAAENEGMLSMDQNLAERFLEDEAKNIESRYLPRSASTAYSSTQTVENRMLDLISERCVEFECTGDMSAALEEEQERQLAPEVEEERQVERPPPAEPATHQVHANVTKFAQTGKIPSDDGFVWAFKSLGKTSAAECMDVDEFPYGLRVTRDFAQTIKRNRSHHGNDIYQRHVQWILTSTDQDDKVVEMVIISPHEANELFETIMQSSKVMLHTYAPRQNQGYAALDNLQLFTVPSNKKRRLIPRHLIIELNLFAGQLYFASFKEYTEVCDFLGLAWSVEDQGAVVRADGFLQPNQRTRNKSSFNESPVQFLKLHFTKVRRDGGGIEKTHMGKVLDGMILTDKDFEARPKRRAIEIEEVIAED